MALAYKAPEFKDDTAELVARFKAEGGTVTRKETRRKKRPALKADIFASERLTSY